MFNKDCSIKDGTRNSIPVPAILKRDEKSLGGAFNVIVNLSRYAGQKGEKCPSNGLLRVMQH